MDLNHRPHPYQGCALPTELQQQSLDLLTEWVLVCKRLSRKFIGEICIFQGSKMKRNLTSQFIFVPNKIFEYRVLAACFVTSP